MFGRLFGSGGGKGGGAKGPPPADLNKSIQTLRSAITQLDKRETHLEKKIAQCLQSAKKKSKARDKKGALYELKKKKQLENQLSSIQGKKLNLETQIMTLEDAHLNKETLKAMKTSKNAMKSAVHEADLDTADDLMDELNEAMDQVQEMNDAMSQPLGPQLDEDELEAELAELEEMEADELLTAMPNAQADSGMAAPNLADDLPAVPTGAISQTQEQDELAELEAMMA